MPQCLDLCRQCGCSTVSTKVGLPVNTHIATCKLTFVIPLYVHAEDNDGIVRELSGETYVDGSIEQDIPVAGLAEIFNCQFFIAAQCNPHIVPFFYNSKGGVGRPSRWSSGTQEASWRGGFLLAGTCIFVRKDHV